MNHIENIFKLQSANRWNISQSSAKERIAKLKKLKEEVLNRREDIKLALFKDLKKPGNESELTEIQSVLGEISFAVKYLKRWMKAKKVLTPVTLFYAQSEICHEAKGVVLIISPWNYPFSLMLTPMVSAIAAGNCIMAKPSEKSSFTSKLLEEIIVKVFSHDEVAIFLGDSSVAKELLELPFDHIFFTGSTEVGKKVMAAAAKNLATVTLELGGKSPVIIDCIVDLKSAVSKIVWGKYLNAGQTCVAPDYVFIPEELKKEFIEFFKGQINQFYINPKRENNEMPDYTRIIDEEGHARLVKMLEDQKNLLDTIYSSDEKYLAPALIETDIKSFIMKNEIFGPILPFITYQKIDEILLYLQSSPRPLALYIFSKQQKFINKILSSTTSGGAVVNNVLLHLANPRLPFGGVGHSGQGSYHGHFGFKAFSHERAVLRQGRLSFIFLYFPPYSTKISKLAFRVLRLFE